MSIISGSDFRTLSASFIVQNYNSEMHGFHVNLILDCVHCGIMTRILSLDTTKSFYCAHTLFISCHPNCRKRTLFCELDMSIRTVHFSVYSNRQNADPALRALWGMHERTPWTHSSQCRPSCIEHNDHNRDLVIEFVGASTRRSQSPR